MTFKYLTVVLVLIAATAQAQETIRDRSLHLEPYVFMGAGQVADVWITNRNFHHGCTEANRGVFGASQPSVGKLVAVKAAGVLPAVIITAFLQKSGHQKAANVMAVLAGSWGFGAAAWNLSVDCRQR